MILTVFTPTYNRAYCLHTLYHSLLKQNRDLFEWMIVDDGSTDNTKDLILQWQKEKKLSIKYYHQKNAGKMAAHNLGVLKCETELFFCVDSDDYLSPNVIDNIISLWNDVKHYNNLCGIVGLRTITNKEVYVPDFSNLKFTTLPDLYAKGFNGETSLIFKTDILRQYPFPIIAGEKFISEDYIYCQIFDKYKMAYIREKTIICTYLKDGYSFNQWKVLMNNPKGSALYYGEKIRRCKNIQQKIYLYRYYIAFCLFSHYSWYKILNDSKFIWLTFILFPLGIYTYFKIKYVRAK